MIAAAAGQGAPHEQGSVFNMAESSDCLIMKAEAQCADAQPAPWAAT